MQEQGWDDSGCERTSPSTGGEDETAYLGRYGSGISRGGDIGHAGGDMGFDRFILGDGKSERARIRGTIRAEFDGEQETGLSSWVAPPIRPLPRAVKGAINGERTRFSAIAAADKPG